MIVALNNKCNLTKEEFIPYQKELIEIKTSAKLIWCPSNIYLGMMNNSNLAIGAQNVNSKNSGAYTGEISAVQLKSLNVKYCIVGHSERREYQHESNEEINNKIKQLLKEDIIPILCVGEQKKDRDNHQEEQIITTEVLEAIKDLSEAEKNKIIIAYEPIWAIGTGLIPTTEEITKTIDVIKNLLPSNKVLYGGSANENNIEELKKVSNIDGYLLGGISLKPEKLKIFLKKLEK